MAAIAGWNQTGLSHALVFAAETDHSFDDDAIRCPRTNQQGLYERRRAILFRYRHRKMAIGRNQEI